MLKLRLIGLEIAINVRFFYSLSFEIRILVRVLLNWLFWMWQTNVTVYEGSEGTEFSDGDVLIFPEMIKYR